MTAFFSTVGATVNVKAPRSVIDYVAWHTECFFARDAQSADATLVVHVPPDRPGELAARAQCPGPLRRVALPTAEGAVCLVDDLNATVHLFLSANDSVHSMHATRVLRAMLLIGSLTAGHCFIHAASVAVNGVGVAFTGPRGAGKTTLLLQCADRLGADIVSNDKTALVAARQDFDMVGYPVRAAIRAGGILALREGPLRSALADEWQQRIGDLAAHRWDAATRLGMRLQDAATAAGVRIVPRARLGAVVAVSLDPKGSTSRLEPLPHPAADLVLADAALPGVRQICPEEADLAISDIHRSMPASAAIRVYRLVQPPGGDAAPLIRDLVDSLPQRGAN